MGNGDHLELRREFNCKVKHRYQKSHEPVCAKCGRYLPFGEGMHVHHIVALIDGGTNDEPNLVTLCGGCHSEYHIYDRDFSEWIKTPPGALIEIAYQHAPELAHFLIDNWEEAKKCISQYTELKYAADQCRKEVIPVDGKGSFTGRPRRCRSAPGSAETESKI